MKDSTKEKLIKFCEFCDSGKPWYCFFGIYLVMLLVNLILLFTDEQKPKWWSILLDVVGLAWSVLNIIKTEKMQKENADI